MAQIQNLGIIEIIDRILPIAEGCNSKVSHGERVVAMILNGLGCIDNRLYLFPDFLDDKPLERLFGKPMDPIGFNDDALGRCLDALSDYGETKLFTTLSLRIGQKLGLIGKSIHIDTTTLTLYGDYDCESEDDTAPIPAYGHSKSRRYDLKQMVLLLAKTGASHFPIWMEAHSGNASDQKTMPTAAAKINQLCKELKDAQDFLYIGDSAMYANILACSDQIQWLTRVPERLSEARLLVSGAYEDSTWTTLDENYSYLATTSNHKSVPQRWVLFFSQAAYVQEIKTLETTIAKEYAAQNKVWRALSNKILKDSEDLKAQAPQTMLKYHKVDYYIVSVQKHTGKGRPKEGVLPETIGYRLEYTLVPDERLIQAARSRRGLFILATNHLNSESPSEAQLLQEYKNQSGVESGFKFIKDDTFQVDSVFLKNPSRIAALLMIMSLCLMVYGTMEYHLHQELVKTGDTIPNALKKPTKKPSLKWVFIIFRVLNEVHMVNHGKVTKIVANLNVVLRQIIDPIGSRAKGIYLDST